MVRFGGTKRGWCVSYDDGVWRSSVARIVRDDEVAGSNPATPTNLAGKGKPDINKSMSSGALFQHISQSFRGAWAIIRRSFRVLKNDPRILIYPYLAVIFILATSPVVGRFVIFIWHKVQQPEVVGAVTKAAPHQLLAHLGLVTFSVFYTIFITSYFTCMISATTLAELEGRQISMLYGLRIVRGRFLRITRYAVLAILFFPIGMIAQRQKFKSLRGAFDVITSSFTLSMSQLAPEIVVGKKSIFETVRHTVNTLGHFWKESLVIRLMTFVSILLLGSISFLPKLIEHYWFNGHTAHVISWIATALLGASSYVLLRVIGAVFTTTLYHEAKNKSGRG